MLCLGEKVLFKEHSTLTGNVPCQEPGGGNEGVYTFTKNPSNRILKMGVFYCMKISLNKVLKQNLKEKKIKGKSLSLEYFFGSLTVSVI